MTPAKRYLALAFAASVSACSTSMPAPSSGYLSDYAALGHRLSTGSSALRSAVPIDPSRSFVSHVEWRLSGDVGLTPYEQVLLTKTLRQTLQRSISTLPAVPGGRPVLVRAAVVRVETVSATVNAISTMLVLAPVDRGGAAVEIEAVDAVSGKQLAAITVGYFAPMSDLVASFSRLVAAERAFERAAADFAPLLQAEL